MSKTMRNASLTIAAVFCAASLAQAQLLNGDFEAGPAGPGAVSWGTFNNAETSTEQARNGANSFKVFGPFFQFGGSGGVQTVSAVPGQTYTLAGYGLSPAADFLTGNNFATLKLEFLNAASGVIGTTESIFNSTRPADVWNLLTSSAVAPAATASVRAVVVHVQMNNPVSGGSVFFDDITLTAGAVPIDPTWITNADGDYFVATNWAAGGSPTGINATANFGSAITAARTITISGPAVLGTLNFANNNRYTLAGTGSVEMSSSSGDAAINLTQGSHTIASQLILATNTNANVAAGRTLTLSGPIFGYNGVFLNTTGAGTVEVAGPVTNTGGTPTLRSSTGTLSLIGDVGDVNLVAAGGVTNVNTTQHVNLVGTEGTGRLNIVDKPTLTAVSTVVLTVASGSTLDLSDNAIIVKYTEGSPFDNVTAALAEGVAGNFTGTGLISSKIPTDSRLGIGIVEASAIGSPATYLGEAIDDTTLIVRTALKGDANLSGSVDFDDLLALAQRYNQAGTWVNGDSTYNGLVNFDDLLALAQNYGGTLAVDGGALSDQGSAFVSDLAFVQAMLPEPGSLAVAAMGLAICRRNRRR